MFRALGIEATTLKLSRNVSIPSFPSMQDSDRGITSDFQSHFKEIAKQYSPVQRGYYVHLTTVIVCIRYDVMDISPLSTISHRTHVALRLRCEQSKTVSCVLAFSERTSFDVFPGYHDLFHHLYNYFPYHITSVNALCNPRIPTLFVFLSVEMAEMPY